MTVRFECPRCQTVFVDDHGDAAFAECPSCGAMALPSGESTDAVNNLSASSPSLSSSEGPPEPSGVTARSGSPGMFAGLLGQSIITGPMAALRPVTGGVDLGLGDDLADFQLPAPTSNRAATTALPRPADKPVSGPSPRAPAPSPRPAATVPELKVSISDDALSAMEAAFDEMASRPQVRPNMGGGLTDEERSFLSEPPAAVAPPRPVSAPPRPAPRPAARRAEPASSSSSTSASRQGRAPAAPIPAVRELALSAEARQAAFLPRQGKSPTTLTPRSEPPSQARATVDALVETTLPEQAIRSPRTQRGQQLNMEPVVAPPVALWSGLRIAACVGIAVIGVVVGAVIGAATAPKREQDISPRGRALSSLAEGNRYFDQQRYDDALGQYKGALSLDRTLAEGHRAKGSALAKLGRHGEAADSYAEYLKLAPDSADAADFQAAIARHRPDRPEGAK